MTEPKVLTLAGIAEGAAEEMFASALEEVLRNIDDPNTDPEKTRVITLQFRFTPDQERRVGVAEIACNTKIAGKKGHAVPVYFGRHQGRFTVVEGPKQAQLFDNAPARPRAVGGQGGTD